MAGNDTNVYSTFLAKRVDVDAKNKMKGFIRDSSHSIPLSVAYHVGHTEQAIMYCTDYIHMFPTDRDRDRLLPHIKYAICTLDSDGQGCSYQFLMHTVSVKRRYCYISVRHLDFDKMLSENSLRD